MNRIWDDYMLLPLNEDDAHPCSFTHIFSDQHSAAYYSHKWSEVSCKLLFVFVIFFWPYINLLFLNQELK